MEYVYRYANEFGTIVYVGITNNLRKRISQHRHDKLSAISSPKITYVSVKNRLDAELLETYLINFYGTSEHYNVKKTNRGNATFLGDVEKMPWIVFDGVVRESKPFVVESKTKTVVKKVVVEKVKTVHEKLSLDSMVYQAWENEREIKEHFESEIETEAQICRFLVNCMNGTQKHTVDDQDLKEGLKLHHKRFVLLKKTWESHIPFEGFDKNLLYSLPAVNLAIENFERDMCKRHGYEYE